MKRRDLIAGLALAGMAPAAEQQESESLYIPKAHLVDDRKFLHDFMDEFSFVELVTAAPEIRVTHIPVVLDRDREVAKKWHIQTLPTTYVLDRGLEPRLMIEGEFQWDRVKAEQLLDAVLSVRQDKPPADDR